MKKELQLILFDKYPEIFKQAKLTQFESCMGRGIECGDGWYEILDVLCGLIQFRLDNPVYVNVTPWYKWCYNRIVIKINNGLYYISYKIAGENPNGFHVYQKGQYEKLPVLTKILRKFSESLLTFTVKEEMVEPEKIQLEFGQVKEKFGRLTIYPDNSNEEFTGMIDMASAMSCRICEVCGKPANLCVRGHWYKTLCSDCCMTETYKDYEKAKSWW